MYYTVTREIVFTVITALGIVFIERKSFAWYVSLVSQKYSSRLENFTFLRNVNSDNMVMAQHVTKIFRCSLD